MNILIIGQCSLHWGRMEFGNIGNYYILEPLVRELHRVFPIATLATTMQLTEDFQKRENIKSLPMSLYYNWQETDLEIAQKEYNIAKQYKETGVLQETTPYIEQVLNSDLVIDFSGDMWGENADLAGKNRFVVGLLKDRIAQLLNKKTVLFLVSPGPFDKENLKLAKETYSNFSQVVLREPESRVLLRKWNFDLSKTKDGACQSILFEAGLQEEIKNINNSLFVGNKPVIGFTICGWNMLKGPFNRDDYKISEFENYIQLIEYCCMELKAKVCLFSHSNGFELPPNFKLIHGRDYKLIKFLYDEIQKMSIKKDVLLLEDIYLPKTIKSIIKNYDMLISGRVHGAIAGLSNSVPTVIIDYGHEPKAHKLKGFAKLYQVEDYVADPGNYDDMKSKVNACFVKRKEISQHLRARLPMIESLARKSTEDIKGILS